VNSTLLGGIASIPLNALSEAGAAHNEPPTLRQGRS